MKILEVFQSADVDGCQFGSSHKCESLNSCKILDTLYGSKCTVVDGELGDGCNLFFRQRTIAVEILLGDCRAECLVGKCRQGYLLCRLRSFGKFHVVDVGYGNLGLLARFHVDNQILGGNRAAKRQECQCTYEKFFHIDCWMLLVSE